MQPVNEGASAPNSCSRTQVNAVGAGGGQRTRRYHPRGAPLRHSLQIQSFTRTPRHGPGNAAPRIRQHSMEIRAVQVVQGNREPTLTSPSGRVSNTSPVCQCRISPRSGLNATASIASPSPRRCSTRAPLALICTPAPTSPRARACSNTVTQNPDDADIRQTSDHPARAHYNNLRHDCSRTRRDAYATSTGG